MVFSALRERGVVALESAIWCVMLLPLGLLGVAMFALAHDGNLVQSVPESLMRETNGRIVTWRSDGDSGFFEVNQGRLSAIIDSLRDRALAAMQQESYKLADISVRACYWVYGVDAVSGALDSAALMSDCRSQGALGAGLQLETPRMNRIRSGIAKPIVVDGALSEFVSRVVLVGVAVGGRYQGLAEYLSGEVVQHGAVWVPRQDVVL